MPIPLVTSQTANLNFYDIESLDNAFTNVICSKDAFGCQRIDVYYRIDLDPTLAKDPNLSNFANWRANGNISTNACIPYNFDSKNNIFTKSFLDSNSLTEDQLREFDNAPKGRFNGGLVPFAQKVNFNELGLAFVSQVVDTILLKNPLLDGTTGSFRFYNLLYPEALLSMAKNMYVEIDPKTYALGIEKLCDAYADYYYNKDYQQLFNDFLAPKFSKEVLLEIANKTNKIIKDQQLPPQSHIKAYTRVAFAKWIELYHNTYTKDTDPDFDKRFLLGYNSANYDMTMLALFFDRSFSADARDAESNSDIPEAYLTDFQTPPTHIIRSDNNRLFNQFTGNDDDGNALRMTDILNQELNAKKIYQSMRSNGHYIDVSNLNESQRRVGLKRLMGMLGLQIFESKHLSHDTKLTNSYDVQELIAYNVSDCLGLRELFFHPVYASNFDLKASMLHTYDDCVFEFDPDPNKTNKPVKSRRLFIDSTSANFVASVLAPNKKLKDLPSVSYNYPNLLGDPNTKINVLEHCKVALYDMLAQIRTNAEGKLSPAEIERRCNLIESQFTNIFDFYRRIEGKNFNDEIQPTSKDVPAQCSVSDHLSDDSSQITQCSSLHKLPEFSKCPTHMFYFDSLGNQSSCYVKFSTGGIHGAEYNKELSDLINSEHEFKRQRIEATKDVLRNLCVEKIFELADANEPLDPLLASDVRGAIEVYRSNPNDQVNQQALRDAVLNEIVDEFDITSYRKLVLPDVTDEQWAARLEQYKTDPTDEKVTQWYEYLKANFYFSLAFLFRSLGKQSLTIELPQSTVDNPLTEVVTYKSKELLSSHVLKRPETIKWSPVRDKSKQVISYDEDNVDSINSAYTYTSMAKVIHEDFSSYYPNLLMKLNAFHNEELGVDRYYNIFLEKERYGSLLKTDLSKEDRAVYKVLREGTKLVLNTASGAGDTNYASNIRMNNRIISMRIIGQLFSWLIGQTQSFAGAHIISTNTDGLYSCVDNMPGLDFEQKTDLNNQILEDKGQTIGILIEPEPMILISKDSNNRLELALPKDANASIADAKILSASGSTLGCFEGPSPRKSLAHPAVIDTALATYLKFIAANKFDQPDVLNPLYSNISLNTALDTSIGLSIFENIRSQAKQNGTMDHALRLFQNVIASSNGSYTFNFAMSFLPKFNDQTNQWEPVCKAPELDDLTNTDIHWRYNNGNLPFDPDVVKVHVEILQHYNRIFFVKPQTPNAVYLRKACGSKTANKNQDRAVTDVARAILKENGFVENTFSAKTLNNPSLKVMDGSRRATIQKISQIDPTWPVLIVNSDINRMSSADQAALLDALDLNIYTTLLENTFNKNWFNKIEL